ncbi:MAG TPA: VCBS repeat-containing protein, partial [Candidatus Dormibacteraeota bacterium]|nr:VCBS repeat-containing protein [Candidatus Dormibacteraeota bacterium]
MRTTQWPSRSSTLNFTPLATSQPAAIISIMPSDAVSRPSPRRIAAALAVLALTGTPAVAQFTPRFQTLAPFSVSIGADPGKHSFVLADVNDDRLLDVITIEPDQTRVDVYINQGNGTFDLVSTPGLANDVTPTSVAVGDIGSPFASDQAGKPDGFPDIVVGGDGGEVEVLFGHNDGQFDTPSDSEVLEPNATSDIVGLVTGDFDEGNGIDVAVLDADGLVLLCNDGNGKLSACTGDTALGVGGAAPSKIVSGDFNADANLDVAVLNPDEQNVGILLGHGDGTFEAVTTVDVTAEATDPNDFTSDMAVARMDSDNIDDIVAVNNSAFNQFFGAIVLGASSGRFRVSNTFVTDFMATAITLADFDAAADRATDAIIGYEDQSPSAVIGDGTGDLGDPFTANGTGQISSSSVMAAGNLGGDTLPDFISLSFDGTQMRVAINHSNDPTPTPGTMTPSPGTTPSPTVTGPQPPTGTITPSSTATFTVTPTATPTPIPTADYGRCDGQVGSNLAAVAAGDL